MIKIEKITFPGANLGAENPMPDIKNISYIHAAYELTDKITEKEKTYIGRRMNPTMLPYFHQDAYDRARDERTFVAAVLEKAIATGRTIVVESEGLDPTGAEEVQRCMDYLKSR